MIAVCEKKIGSTSISVKQLFNSWKAIAATLKPIDTIRASRCPKEYEIVEETEERDRTWRLDGDEIEMDGEKREGKHEEGVGREEELND